jgi:hypothetical protein
MEPGQTRSAFDLWVSLDDRAETRGDGPAAIGGDIDRSRRGGRTKRSLSVSGTGMGVVPERVKRSNGMNGN